MTASEPVSHTLGSLMLALGSFGLLIASAAVIVSVICLIVAHFLQKNSKEQSNVLSFAGHIATLLTMGALTFCCVIIVYCLFSGDNTIEYVVKNRTTATDGLRWLYLLSGLWGGKSGSLLFWAWLISVFNSVVALRNIKKLEKLDNAAIFVTQLILATFVGVLMFSQPNQPFFPTAAEYLNSQGELLGAAKGWGMNMLLEHWAMVVHPPTLFVGYAGLTIPFAYAIAALLTGDSSKAWVEKSSRITMFSWLFLGLGIGIGSVWAYVVLGWGGYWGWDPVENASLLPWLVGVALIHSFTVYRRRGAFKRWSIICACITFSFVILGTFITRTGIVQSVHAFQSDPVSFALFLALIIVPLVAGIIGIAIRWVNFSAETVGGDDFESLFSKDVAYYFSNLLLIFAAVLLAFMTLFEAISGAFFAEGTKFSAPQYEWVARVLGILFMLLLAVCPLLAWSKTDRAAFLKKAKIPAICTLVVFVGAVAYFIIYLLPTYQAVTAGNDRFAEALLEQGPSFIYNGVALIGLLVACLLFFNALFILARGIGRYSKNHNEFILKTIITLPWKKASTFGGFISHVAMAIILAGLIGSSMYVTEKVGYMKYDYPNDKALETFTIKDYTLEYVENKVDHDESTHGQPSHDIVYSLTLKVYKGDKEIGTVTPSIKGSETTTQQRFNAAVISLPTEDLFVVYHGVDKDYSFSLDVRVNPLINFVWVGFALLMVGALVSTVGRRKAKALKKGSGEDSDGDDDSGESGSASGESKSQATESGPSHYPLIEEAK